MEFQNIIMMLQRYWAEHGCAILTPIDRQVGAGTLHPATFFGLLNARTPSFAYVQQCRRPDDGMNMDCGDRFQSYFQFQVIVKPAGRHILDLYWQSLASLGFERHTLDLKFLKDDWKAPGIGAFGKGWEVAMNGIEVSQITYFESMGSMPCESAVEVTYGLERLAMILNHCDTFSEMAYSASTTYGDWYLMQELEMSRFNYSDTNFKRLREDLDKDHADCQKLLANNYIYPAYELVLTMNHSFNLLSAKGWLSLSEKRDHIHKLRDLSSLIAIQYTKAIQPPSGLNVLN
jgi:glycyl-tRNA synthetase alpha chain